MLFCFLSCQFNLLSKAQPHRYVSAFLPCRYTGKDFCEILEQLLVLKCQGFVLLKMGCVQLLLDHLCFVLPLKPSLRWKDDARSNLKGTSHFYCNSELLIVDLFVGLMQTHFLTLASDWPLGSGSVPECWNLESYNMIWLSKGIMCVSFLKIRTKPSTWCLLQNAGNIFSMQQNYSFLGDSMELRSWIECFTKVIRMGILWINWLF